MTAPVFISYARKSSGAYARALYEDLGSETCFLDTEDLEIGASEFPCRLTEALLGARVFVALIDQRYFERWYCLREWLLARAPFDELLRRGAPADAAALEHIIVALMPGADNRALEHLPPPLRRTNWPQSDATRKLAELTRSRLSVVSETLATRCDRCSVPASRRSAMVDEAAMPLPKNLAGMPMYPRTLPSSLQSRFVGRVNDIWRVHTALTEARLDSLRLAPLTGALQGGGGFGKTQLAREYAHRFGPTYYPDGCFWIDAGGSAPVDQQFHGVLSTLRKDMPTLEEMRRLGRDVRAELVEVLHADAASKSLLFVVDNVPEPEAGKAPLPLDTWCPGLGKVTCLATSRKRLDEPGAIDAIDIDVLEVAAAVDLLTGGILGADRLRKAQWEEVAEWVGRLPLALTLLNAAVRKGGVSPSRLWEMSREGASTLALDAQKNALRGAVPEGALRGISEAFAMSYRLLDEGGKRLARLIAWLAPAPIPDELLSTVSSGMSGAASRIALVDRSFLVEARGVTGDSPTGWQMHRVLADFLRIQSEHPINEILAGFIAVQSILKSADLGKPAARTLGLAVVVHAAHLGHRLREQLASRPSGLREVWVAMVHVALHLRDLGERTGESHPLEAAALLLSVASSLAERAGARFDWALTQDNLGTVLHALGKREEGTARLIEAATAFRAALEVRTRERAPLEWAATQNNLGNVLHTLGAREIGTERLKEAEAAFRAALEVDTYERAPEQWAATQNSLGNVLRNLGERERNPERLKESEAAYRAALKVYTRERAPLTWAGMQHNLGNVFQMLSEGETNPERLLKEAEAAFRAALEVRTRDCAPLDWAATQNSLGNVLDTLGDRDEDTARFTEAAAAYGAALEVRTRERTPLDWAMTQYNLGQTLKRLGERNGNMARLNEAEAAHRAALEVFTPEGALLWWAKAQNGLGVALITLGTREGRTARLAQAIEGLRATLKVCTRERAPMEWAMTMTNLATALAKLGALEERTELLRDAVATYRAALEVDTRERAPLEWAMTQHNLGIVLRALGERDENMALLNEAAAAFRAELEVYTPERTPRQWAVAQDSLKNVFKILDDRRA